MKHWACFFSVAVTVALVPATANASPPPPVLEFSAAAGFPIPFGVEDGEVTAVLANFDTLVRCSDSAGAGEVTGPRSTVSSYTFTGCNTQGGTEGGHPCKSEGANAEEIRSPDIEGDLVFIDQAKRAVGILLAPDGGTYLEFECGGQSVRAIGPFLAPVGPINQEATSFTASLFRSGASQIPDEYEGAGGERLPAVPTGEKGSEPPASTGVELSFSIQPTVPLTVKAVTSAEIEARQREEEAAAERKRQEEAAAATRQREAEAAAAAAKEKRELAAAARKRAQQRSKALTRCRQSDSKPKRVRCERRVKRRFGPPIAKPQR